MKPDPTRRRLAMTAAVLAVGLGASYVAVQAATPPARVIKIVAQRFKYTPAHLTLKKGEPVVFELTTRDVLMGFNLPDFNLRADMIPDQVTRIAFMPDRSGTFTFVCDIFCGSGHEAMQGSITVVE